MARATLMAGRLSEWVRVRRAHQQLGELALLKWRLRRTGGDASSVRALRREIRAARQAEAHLASEA